MPVARPPRPTRSLRSGDRQQWWVLDAADQTLGRLAARVASLLRGKENILFTPHADAGDFVVIVNAERVRLTGRKREQKIYYRHTGYVGTPEVPHCRPGALRRASRARDRRAPCAACSPRPRWAESSIGSSRSIPVRIIPTRRSSRRS